MPDMIFVSMEDWDDIWRRNQFLASRFARAFPERKILFVGLPRNFSHAVRRGRWHDLAVPALRQIPNYPNIWFLKPWKLFPNSIDACRELNDSLFRSTVRSVARQLSMRRPLLWLNPHYALHMVRKMNESSVIYDITDDWIELTQSETLRARTRQQDATLCAIADQVIVCSQQLLHAKRPLARRLTLVPNGVDAEHYRTVLEGSGPLPDFFKTLKRPILGYTGTIHPDRVDVALVEAMAASFGGSIALVGPNMLSDADTCRLTARGNVHFSGPVPYQQIPQYMRGFDVAIAPHKVTPFTESLNPIKLWEYLAAGKPIIATPVAGFRDYPEFAYLATTAHEHHATLQQALAEPPLKAAARRAEARKHSWDSRVAQIMPLILQSQQEAAPHAA